MSNDDVLNMLLDILSGRRTDRESVPWLFMLPFRQYASVLFWPENHKFKTHTLQIKFQNFIRNANLISFPQLKFLKFHIVEAQILLITR